MGWPGDWVLRSTVEMNTRPLGQQRPREVRERRWRSQGDLGRGGMWLLKKTSVLAVT